MDVNLMAAKCIQDVHHIGRTVYVNICDGSRVEVAWGSGDWVAGMVLAAVGLLLTLSILTIIYTTWREGY